jgi:hypothetical protein
MRDQEILLFTVAIGKRISSEMRFLSLPADFELRHWDSWVFLETLSQDIVTLGSSWKL